MFTIKDDKKPLYRRWWFWLILVVILVGAGLTGTAVHYVHQTARTERRTVKKHHQVVQRDRKAGQAQERRPARLPHLTSSSGISLLVRPRAAQTFRRLRRGSLR